MAKFSDAFSRRTTHDLELVITEDSSSSANNTSSVTATLQINPPADSASWSLYSTDNAYSMTFEGQEYTGNFTFDYRTNRSTQVLVSKTKTVRHGEDGDGTARARGSVTTSDGSPNALTIGNASIGNSDINLVNFSRIPSAPSAGPTLTRGTGGTTATVLSTTAAYPTADPAATITSYQYQQSTTTSFTGATAVTMATPPASTSLTGLTAAQAYYYQTRAVNIDGSGPWSATSTLPPTQPTALTGAVATSTTVELDWDGTLTSLERYKVEYKRAVDSTWTNSGYTGTTSAYTVTGLTQNTIYDFRVLAENPTNVISSGYATLVRATLPSTPTNLSVVSFTASDVSLNWDDNPVGFTAYKVEYKVSSSPTWVDSGYTGTTSAYTVSGLSFNTEYNFRVSALNSSNSTQSGFVTATQTTLPAGPPVRTSSTTWSPSEVYVRTNSGTPAWTLGAMYVWNGTSWKVVG